MLALIARIAGIAAFCSAAVYLTSAAFVPAMGTGRWDFVFGAIALGGLSIGAAAALADFLRKRRDTDRKP